MHFENIKWIIYIQKSENIERIFRISKNIQIQKSDSVLSVHFTPLAIAVRKLSQLTNTAGTWLCDSCPKINEVSLENESVLGETGFDVPLHGSETQHE